MTLSQICTQCTDRACHLCPIKTEAQTKTQICANACPLATNATPCARCEFRTGAPSAKRLTDIFGDVVTQTFAPLAPAHRHDVELDLYYSDLDMDGGE